VDAADKVGSKRRMNRAVPRDSGHRRKGRGLHHHAEMGFAAFAPPTMSPVLFAFIRDGQRHGSEGFGKARMYFIGGSHFRLSTPSIPRRNP
jgi:hypothetical protein